MYQEDEPVESPGKSREFGVLGDVLRTLQMEELEESRKYSVKITESDTEQNLTKLIVEINNTLKEIAETQKKILEEIKRKKSE